MGSDFSFSKRISPVLGPAMALGVLSSLACGDSSPVSAPSVAQQQQKLQWTTASPTAAASPEQASVPLQPAPSNVLQKSVQTPSGSAPRVLYRACRALRETEDGLICLQAATSRTLLWVEGQPCEKLEVTEDDQPIPVVTRYVQGGCQISRKQPSSAVRFTLGLRSKDTGAQFWNLPMDRSMPWLLEWTAKFSNRAVVDLDGVDAELRNLAVQQAHPAVSLDMLFARADVLLRLGHNELAISSFSQVSESAARLGYPSIAFDAAHKYFVAFMDSGLTDDADLVLHKAKAFIRSGAIGPEVQWNYDAGQIYYLTGRLADAELALREATLNAERLDVSTRRVTMPLWAAVLLAMNRYEEAWNLQKSSASLLSTLNECEKADLLANLAELRVLFMQDQEHVRSTPGCDLAQSRSLFKEALESRRKCTDNRSLAKLHTGLAFLSLLENQLKDARAELDMAKNVQGATHIDRMDMLNLEGRISLHENRPKEAQQSFAKLDQLVKDYPDSHASLYECQSAAGQLEATALLGKSDPEVAARVQGCLRTERLPPYDRNILESRVGALLKRLE